MLLKNNFNTQTKIFGLIGHPIEHSVSPIMHNVAFRDLGLNYIYTAFDIKSKQLKRAIKGFKTLGIKGFNVTIPHKVHIIKYLDEIDPMGKKIGAINTVKNQNGVLIGRNYDAMGAKQALIDADCEIKEKNILILGAGGAARAIGTILAEKAKKIIIVNRTEIKAIKLAQNLKKRFNIEVEGKINSERIIREEIRKADILINTTPVGMYPKVNQSPIKKENLHENLFVFDVIYNPLKTHLIKDANKVGCKTLNGLDMLVNQGMLAFEWWTNKKPNIDIIRNKIIEFLEKR